MILFLRCSATYLVTTTIYKLKDVGKREVIAEEVEEDRRGIIEEVGDERRRKQQQRNRLTAAAAEDRSTARTTARSSRCSVDRPGRPTCTTSTRMELGRPPGRPTESTQLSVGHPVERPVDRWKGSVDRPVDRQAGCGLRLLIWKSVVFIRDF